MAIVRAYPIRVAGPMSAAQAAVALAGIPVGLGITPVRVRDIVEEFDGQSVVTYEVEIDPVTRDQIDLARKLLLANTERAVGGEAVTTGLEASSSETEFAGELAQQDHEGREQREQDRRAGHQSRPRATT